MERALFLTPVAPARSGNGLAMRAGLFLDGMARSHAVHVVVAPVVAGPPRDEDFLAARTESVTTLELEPAQADRADLMRRRLATARGRERAQALGPPPLLCRRLPPEASAAVADLASGCAAVHVLRIYLAPLLDALLDAPPGPSLSLDVDDFESRTRERLGEGEEAARFARLEAHYLPLMDQVTAASGADSGELGRIAGRPVEVVPNAVRPPERPPRPSVRRELVMVGNLSYAPNIDGARWLCEEVLPLIADARAVLVGSTPAPEVSALAGEPVEVAADVPEVAPFYERARLAVAPIRSGGGTRTKVLEALAHGRPVVSTTAGLEGIELGEAEGVLRADDPPGFAAACERLLGDPGGAAEMGARGREAVIGSIDVTTVATRIDQLLSCARGRQPRAGR